MNPIRNTVQNSLVRVQDVFVASENENQNANAQLRNIKDKFSQIIIGTSYCAISVIGTMHTYGRISHMESKIEDMPEDSQSNHQFKINLVKTIFITTIIGVIVLFYLLAKNIYVFMNLPRGQIQLEANKNNFRFNKTEYLEDYKNLIIKSRNEDRRSFQTKNARDISNKKNE